MDNIQVGIRVRPLLDRYVELFQDVFPHLSLNSIQISFILKYPCVNFIVASINFL